MWGGAGSPRGPKRQRVSWESQPPLHFSVWHLDKWAKITILDRARKTEHKKAPAAPVQDASQGGLPPSLALAPAAEHLRSLPSPCLLQPALLVFWGKRPAQARSRMPTSGTRPLKKNNTHLPCVQILSIIGKCVRECFPACRPLTSDERISRKAGLSAHTERNGPRDRRKHLPPRSVCRKTFLFPRSMTETHHKRTGRSLHHPRLHVGPLKTLRLAMGQAGRLVTDGESHRAMISHNWGGFRVEQAAPPGALGSFPSILHMRRLTAFTPSPHT